MKRIIDHLKENGLKYGFETLVITIGILGAFGLNNWNDNQKERKQEEEIVIDLHGDFRKNVVEIRRVIDINYLGLKSTVATIQLIGPYPSNSVRFDIDSLIFLALEFSHISTSENALDDLIEKIFVLPALQLLVNKYHPHLEKILLLL